MPLELTGPFQQLIESIVFHLEQASKIIGKFTEQLEAAVQNGEGRVACMGNKITDGSVIKIGDVVDIIVGNAVKGDTINILTIDDKKKKIYILPWAEEVNKRWGDAGLKIGKDVIEEVKAKNEGYEVVTLAKEGKE